MLTRQQHPKFSRELLNLRKIQETLAKRKECVRVLRLLKSVACADCGGGRARAATPRRTR